MLPRGYFLPQNYNVRQGNPSTLSQHGFTADEMARITALRRRYEQDQDLFSDREVAHLRFQRWLVAMGRTSS